MFRIYRVNACLTVWFGFVFIKIKYSINNFSCMQDGRAFTLYVHYDGHFSENYQEYVGGEVGVVDGCDPNKWFKVEIKSICKDFGYTCLSRLWYTRPRDDD